MSQIVKKGTTTIVAGDAGSTNLLASSDVEFISFPCLVTLRATESAAGLVLTFKNGAAQTMVDKSEPNIASAAGITRKPDDELCEGVLLPQGGHLVLNCANPTGGNLDLNYYVMVEAIPT
jgi:hypothetical protein